MHEPQPQPQTPNPKLLARRLALTMPCGRCEKNPGSMLSLCPQSCGVCQDLEKFKKDEL